EEPADELSLDIDDSPQFNDDDADRSGGGLSSALGKLAATDESAGASQEPQDPAWEAIRSLPEWELLRGENIAATPSAAESDLTAEERRTRLSVICAIDAYRGNMTRFPNLTDEQRAALQADTAAVGDEEAFGIFVYDLVTHDIGKNPQVAEAIGASADMDHDEVYAELIANPAHVEARQRFLPGFDALPAWGQQRLTDMAIARLNYPQALQGEAPAPTLAGVESIQDPRVIEWEILKAKFDIFGALGHVNGDVSLTATEGTYRRMQNLDATLRDPNLTTAEDRNNAFLDSEIAHFMGTVQPRDQAELTEWRTLANLECRMRISNQSDFDSLRTAFEAQPPLVRAILTAELTRSTRATLAYYSPALLRTIAEKEDLTHALTYFAHIMQEAHIADIEARRAGLDGISTVLLGEFLKGVQSGAIDTKETAMRFLPQDGALVAVPRETSLETLAGIAEFADVEALRGKRIILVGEGGGSDCIQAAMLGMLLARKYSCEIMAVVSSRNEERQTANTGWRSGTLKEVTPETSAVGDWRFLEKIPAGGSNPMPMYILNSSDPFTISRDIGTLARLTGADVVMGVDTGGDSLYTALHPGFSARAETDITPDHDYNTISGLSRFARENEGIRVFSVTVAPGVDSPRYAAAVLGRIGAAQIPLSDEDTGQINRTYAEWRMDGSGSEEGRYGKTPLAWLHALNGRTGFRLLDLPRANATSDDNPWRSFMTVTPAMAGIVIADMKDHFEAIERPNVQGIKEPFDSPRTAEVVNSFKPVSQVSFTWTDDIVLLRYKRPGDTDAIRHSKGIGGAGITHRQLSRLEQEIPGIQEVLMSTAGKVVFLGNGLSTAPLELLELRRDNAPEIVLVDAIDYRLLQTDLHRLQASFDAALIESPPSLRNALVRCNLIVKAESEGRLRIVSHIIGDPGLPPEARDADIAVNVYGPPLTTIDEQLLTVKPEGKLYISGGMRPWPIGGTVFPISPSRDDGFIIVRRE
ncbi:MAG TPA: hypothetical protein VFM05_05685, partial [Candidatus Saccharimonadales bacterium]|nr:hypothetical protein [Candidatus Saccharimonadales bacterium]